jgi:hypothetical protein
MHRAQHRTENFRIGNYGTVHYYTYYCTLYTRIVLSSEKYKCSSPKIIIVTLFKNLSRGIEDASNSKQQETNHE